MPPHQVVTDPHAPLPITAKSLVSSVWRHRDLISQMSRREVVGRYKGSALGLMWSFFNPLFMLSVYTFVFSEIFSARWAETPTDTSKTAFAVILFVGMIVQGLFAETLNKSPNTILVHVNFVKKVVFPLEILPIVNLCAALFHTVISVLVLLGALVLLNGHLYWTTLLFPIVIFPLVLMSLGVSWILASLGVFLRDVGQVVTIITTVLMFLSPVFYPVSAVPERFRPFILANPLTLIIEQARETLIWGRLPNWTALGLYTAAAGLVAWGGYAWFQKTRKGFADVL